MTEQSLPRRILILGPEADLNQELAQNTKFYGFRSSDTIQCFTLLSDASQYMRESPEGIAIAIIFPVLDEGTTLAQRVRQARGEFGGIDFYSLFRDRIQHAVFLTTRTIQQKMLEGGFELNSPDREVCLMLHGPETAQEDRYPNNLRGAIERAYARLDALESKEVPGLGGNDASGSPYRTDPRATVGHANILALPLH